MNTLYRIVKIVEETHGDMDGASTARLLGRISEIGIGIYHVPCVSNAIPYHKSLRRDGDLWSREQDSTATLGVPY